MLGNRAFAIAAAARPTASRVALVGRRGFQSSAVCARHWLDADAPTLEKAVANKDRITLVDFYADWCRPCKMLSPILEKLTADGSGVKSGTGLELDLVTIDTEAQTALAQKYQISSLPTVIAFKDGEPVSQFMGAMPEGSVRNFIAGL